MGIHSSSPSALFAKGHTYIFDDPGNRKCTKVLLRDNASSKQTINGTLMVQQLEIEQSVDINGSLFVRGLIDSPMLRQVKVSLDPAAVTSLVSTGTIIVPRMGGFTPLMYHAVAKYNFKTTPYVIATPGVTLILSYGLAGSPARQAAAGFIWDGFLDQVQSMTMAFIITNVNTPSAFSANTDLLLTTNGGLDVSGGDGTIDFYFTYALVPVGV